MSISLVCVYIMLVYYKVNPEKCSQDPQILKRFKIPVYKTLNCKTFIEFIL